MNFRICLKRGHIFSVPILAPRFSSLLAPREVPLLPLELFELDATDLATPTMQHLTVFRKSVAKENLLKITT